MSSTTPSTSGFLSSPRMQQRLLWISAAVLLIGVAVFLGVYLTRGTSTPAASRNISTVGSPPSHTNKPKSNAKVPASADALKVARTFLETAVVRKNLDAAYGIVGPDIKAGMSRKQWRTGNIAVSPYPAMNAKTAKFHITESHPNELFAQVALYPRKGSGVNKPLAFNLGVQRLGGKWVVNYWLPEPQIKVRPTPYS